MSARSEERKRRLAVAIEACRNADGIIEKKRIVEAAKDDPDNPLHVEFDWNLESAANTAWLARAGELIAECRTIVQYRGREVAVPTYIPNPRRVDGGHVRTIAVASNAALKETALRAELDRIRAAIHRALSLAQAFDLEEQFEEMLQRVVDVELALDEPV